jgi:hypothetical protein
MKLIFVSRNFANAPAESRMLAGDKWRSVPAQHLCEEYLCFFYILRSVLSWADELRKYVMQ